MKLLFAEDTRDLNRAVTAVLTSQGYEVDSVYDGAEALEHIQQNSYDGIILDIMMPKTDGISVLREIRGMGELTPVLLLTAKAEVDDRVAGLYLEKIQYFLYADRNVHPGRCTAFGNNLFNSVFIFLRLQLFVFFFKIFRVFPRVTHTALMRHLLILFRFLIYFIHCLQTPAFYFDNPYNNVRADDT